MRDGLIALVIADGVPLGADAQMSGYLRLGGR
jgi:hypothetical protein